MAARRRGGPGDGGGEAAQVAWDRASALCALARLLLEVSLVAPDERVWAELRGWPGVEAVPAPLGEPGVEALEIGGERVGVRVAGGPPDLWRALAAAGELLAAARRRWEADRRRDEQVRRALGAGQVAGAEAEAARAESALWRGYSDELRSTIGHDLRNPLSVLSGHAQLLEAGLVGQLAARTTGETLLRQVDRLTGMFDRLVEGLAVAASAAGRGAASVDLRAWEPIGDSVAAVVAELPSDAARRIRVVGGPEAELSSPAEATAGAPGGDAGAPVAGRVALGAVLRAALLAGQDTVSVEVTSDPTGGRVTVTSSGLRRGRPDPRTGWKRAGADPSGAIAAVARYVRALRGELDAAPGRVTLTWLPPGPEVVGLVADPGRADALAALVLPPLRVVVRVGDLGALPSGAVLVDATPEAHAAWREAHGRLSPAPPAVLLGAPADADTFAALPADASAAEVTAELARALAAPLLPPSSPEPADLVLELEDDAGILAAVGADGPERALRWVEGVAQWLAGSAARVSRGPDGRVRVAGVRGDPGVLGARIVECCAGMRPRIGPFRVSVPVRAVVRAAGALQDPVRLGGPAAPGETGSRD